MTVKKVPDALKDLGDIYRERNAVYGDTYKNFGRVMKGFFPGDVTLVTEEDWNRMALFFHCADKLARYAGSFTKGGHVDSLDDNSVYSQMLQEYDAERRLEAKDKEGKHLPRTVPKYDYEKHPSDHSIESGKTDRT